MSNSMSKMKQYNNNKKIANYTIAVNNIKNQNNICGVCKDKLLDIDISINCIQFFSW